MANKSPKYRGVASTLTQAELLAACEKLVKITQAPPEGDCCHPFSINTASHYVPNHRCLSKAEAGIKLQAVEQLARQPVAQLLADGWKQLSPMQLLDVECVLLRPETGERTQPFGDQAPAWCRLDEQLFRLALTAWIKGTNFAVAPRPHMLARQVGIDAAGYKECLQELRVALARPAVPSARWPPRVSLWLGDPPPGEVGPPMPRLWVSARALEFTEADAAKLELFPADTLIQEHLSLEQLCRRWILRANTFDLAPEAVETSLQYTICCRCSQTLGVKDLR